MKKLVFIFSVIMLTACSSDQPMKPTTPMNTAHLMKLHIDSQNYDYFQSLFSEGREDVISEETFESFGELSTSGANFKNYELLTFDNGEMLLIEFKPQLDNEEELKIVNVIRVPDNMKELFEVKN
ncbi:hypothetical protein SAMN05421839_1428 [Halolactibacillus halophilus]|uniref:Uncharacterized protein n=1 Tax=Halolactibacillus halophilus TaxID=306540 RepID=A0A1I5SC97_9BACI|nr:hypothetical protein [Halolactibacillus halophilus]GEM02534.1 hypothetical protein HHA03_20660 [Halolactibacillus halophilus]SFP68340.1 hypothetical protein SAMN05421839_1428 [Halolactibacillus halophilus]